MGGLEAQAAARAQLQEVEPAIRYCSYRLGGTDGADAAGLAADLPSTPTSDLLGVRRCVPTDTGLCCAESQAMPSTAL